MKKNLLFIICFAFYVSASFTLKAQTQGLLTVTYTQNVPAGASKNVLAVWIESGTGSFIKTKMRYVSSQTKDHLPSWAVKSGGSLTNATSASCNTTDATTGATRTSSTNPAAYGSKTFTWDGKNVSGAVNGTTVADGVYKVWIESSWNDGPPYIHNAIASFSFTKGVATDHQTPAGDANFTAITIDWVPSAVSVENIENDEVNAIFPNPSDGVFTVQYLQATEIVVENIIGAVVYKENVFEKGVGSKYIDLSKFTNGIYFVNVVNNNISKRHKIILNK